MTVAARTQAEFSVLSRLSRLYVAQGVQVLWPNWGCEYVRACGCPCEPSLERVGI